MALANKKYALTFGKNHDEIVAIQKAKIDALTPEYNDIWDEFIMPVDNNI